MIFKKAEVIHNVLENCPCCHHKAYITTRATTEGTAYYVICPECGEQSNEFVVKDEYELADVMQTIIICWNASYCRAKTYYGNASDINYMKQVEQLTFYTDLIKK